MRLPTRLLLSAGVFSAVIAAGRAQTTRPGLTGDMPPAHTACGIETNDTSSFMPAPDLSGEIYTVPVNKTFFPRVFSGYRHIGREPRYTVFPDPEIARETMRHVWCDIMEVIPPADSHELAERNDSTATNGLCLYPDSTATTGLPVNELANLPDRDELTVAFGSVTPDWLKRSLEAYRFQEDFIYGMMIENPSLIEYAYWDLPVPPRLPEEDHSFLGYLRRLDLPEVKTDNLPVHANGGRINWLHTFNIGLQLSQSYVSGNWYQGGTSHLAFFGNFLWDVLLNSVYYPKLMFQSTVSYKLAINSTPDDQYHKYNVSQDLFQYNLKMGYKAVYNWYYSFLMQFKTQFLHNYPANSMTRTASFMSPGELNLGLGMTYSKENKAKTLRFSASISPISYNFKTCIDDMVDRAQFGIKPGRKTLNEIGSNAEVNFMAKLWGNTTYTTRLFIFSDYKTFQTDWENTLNFQFTRVFSTQIYAHLRYDTSADASIDRKWKKLMLKEILSVGISYSFSTK